MTTTSPLPEPFARIAGAVRAIAVFPDGNRVVVGGDDPAVRNLDLLTGALRGSLGRPTGKLLAATATWDDRIVLCGTEDITVWQLGDSPTYVGVPAWGSVTAAAVSPGGDAIVAVGSNGIRLWERGDDGYTERAGPLVEWAVRAVETTSDGDRIVVGGHSPAVLVLRRDGFVSGSLGGHRPDVVSIAATPDGAWIASLDRDRVVRLWPAAASRAEPIELTGHSGGVLKVALSSDGRQVVAGDLAGKIWVWQRTEPGKPSELSGHGAPVTAFALTPDNQRLVSGAEDGTVRLWDLANNAEIDPARPGGHGPRRVARRRAAGPG